ncbi:hypothetical protein [Paraburkholderia sp. Cpub6]|uniref:hypothetical protein n=1 Tax=Paraburkholderia sp. Cpub6 TaxID=2723094 RepID=UPI001622DCC8|nr:hypothetical protein [Paraburkholderia sp. Cpub6]MBB5461050.1 hypothetical protein [Paraburkholderia sp. Cpub6]
MRIFDSNFLRRRGRAPSDQGRRTHEAVARVLAMNPGLRYAPHCEERLSRALKTSLEYTDKLVASLPPACAADAHAWSSDPAIRAFFATPDDLARAFSRSDAMRDYFERQADATEGYAVLGMAMTERHVLGVAQEGGSIRHDVPQTTLCFGDHWVRICSDSEASLRAEIGRRMVDQLALEGVASLATNRRKLVKQSRDLLEKRVALLERQGTGMRAVLGVPPVTETDELARIQAEMKENAQALAKLRVPGKQGERELDGVCDVLSKPSEHLYVKSRSIRVDMMNVVQPEGSMAGRLVEFHFACIPGNPAITRAFVLARFPRCELLRGGLHIDAATRAI